MPVVFLPLLQVQAFVLDYGARYYMYVCMYESSHGSFDEYTLSPRTKPSDLDCESASRLLPPTPPARQLLLLLLLLHFA